MSHRTKANWFTASRISAVLLLCAASCRGQTPTQISTVTSLPATCNGGTPGVATDYVMLIGAHNQSVPFVCVRPNTWQVATNPSGTADVRNYGAKCDGKTDDTDAFNAAIAATGPPTYSEQRVYVPNTGLGCVVSEINATNISNRVTIAGDNGGVQFISVIKCQEASPGTGVCIDFTGSNYVTLENLRFGHGSNPPKAVVRMGRTTAGTSDFIHTRNLDVECYGSGYGVYNNGGEIWQSFGDVFEGCRYPVVLSAAANCGDVPSRFLKPPFTCPPKNVSMTNVQFFAPFFGSDVGGGFGLMFDPGRGGSVEDVNIFGGYAQTIEDTIALFGDKPGSAGGIRGFTVIGLRDEPQGPVGIAPFMKFTNELDEADIHAKFAPVADPGSPAIQLGAVQASSFNVQPADNPKFYANPFMTCSGPVTATVAYLYTKSGGSALANSCPGETEYYKGTTVVSAPVSTALTTTVKALETPTTIVGTTANSGILLVHDETGGGSALFMIDPNGGSQLMGTSQITGLVNAGGITFSGGVWSVTLSSGAIPRVLKTTIFKNP